MKIKNKRVKIAIIDNIKSMEKMYFINLDYVIQSFKYMSCLLINKI